MKKPTVEETTGIKCDGDKTLNLLYRRFLHIFVYTREQQETYKDIKTSSKTFLA